MANKGRGENLSGGLGCVVTSGICKHLICLLLLSHSSKFLSWPLCWANRVILDLGSNSLMGVLIRRFKLGHTHRRHGEKHHVKMEAEITVICL